MDVREAVLSEYGRCIEVSIRLKRWLEEQGEEVEVGFDGLLEEHGRIEASLGDCKRSVRGAIGRSESWIRRVDAWVVLTRKAREAREAVQELEATIRYERRRRLSGRTGGGVVVDVRWEADEDTAWRLG